MKRYFVEFKLAGSSKFDNYYGDYVIAEYSNQAVDMVCEWFFENNPEINEEDVKYRVLNENYEIIGEGWCDLCY